MTILDETWCNIGIPAISRRRERLIDTVQLARLPQVDSTSGKDSEEVVDLLLEL
jgi:hypothetical protein